MQNIGLSTSQVEQLRQACQLYLHNCELQQQVFDAITYFLHKTPVLLKMYFNWINMENFERLVFNCQILQVFSSGKHMLYASVIKAFEFWSTLQDTQGAPGFKANPLTFELSSEIENDLKNIVRTMDQLINQILAKRKLKDGIIKSKVKLKCEWCVANRGTLGNGAGDYEI